MAGQAGSTARIAGLLLATVLFAITQPPLLIGVPLAVLLLSYGPRDARTAVVILAVVALALLGPRSGLWWFERGWALLLGGAFVWTTALARHGGFTSRALAALALAFLIGAAVLGLSPTAWREIDGAMAARADQAARLTADLLGGGVGDAVGGIAGRVATLQAALFPALLGLSSLGALGVAAWIRAWLAGDEGPILGPLRGFRFNDHLIWVWLAGLLLLVAPVGDPGLRIGGNAVLFMGILYALRGIAVAVALWGGLFSLGGMLLALAVLVVL